MARNKGDFDDEEGFLESLMKRRGQVPMPHSMVRLLSIVAGVIVLTIISMVAWAVWPSGSDQEDSVPVVRADEAEYKVQPDEPGGMPIPNKDSTVFESMGDSASGEKKTENLLEDQEQPMKKEVVFEESAENNSEDTPPPTPTPVAVDEPKAKVEESAPASTVPKETPKEEAKPTPVKEDVKVEKKKTNIIETLKEEAGTQKETTAKAKPAAKGSVYIQLAAVKSEADTKSKWAKLQSTYPSLKSLSMRSQKADLGAKGIFYRIQAGPLSAAAANSTCAKIKSAGGACIIAK